MKYSKIFPKILTCSFLLGIFGAIYGAEELATAPQSLPLIEAIKAGNIRKTLQLIRTEDTNQKDTKGRTPLMFAVQQSPHIASILISNLLQKNANIDAQDSEGLSALTYASLANKPQAVRQLLAKGAQTEIPQSIIIPENIRTILLENNVKKETNEVIDPITGQNITSLNEDELIAIGKPPHTNTYAKTTLRNYIINQLGSNKLEEIRDPISRVIIGRDKVIEVAKHFGIPVEQLETPEDLDTIQQIPSGITEEEYVSIQQHYLRDAIAYFKGIIKNDTLRSLSHRLQERQNRLAMYPVEDESWGPNEHKLIQLEAGILERTIKDRIKKFERSKLTTQTESSEPFMYFG